jgi:hypothetical protein
MSSKVIHPKDNPTLEVRGLFGEYEIKEPYYNAKFQQITDAWEIGWFGYHHTISSGLVPNTVYKIIKIEVNQSSTYYTIEGITGRFNSGMFDIVN